MNSSSSQESQLKPGGNTKTPGFKYQAYRWFVVLPHVDYTASQLSQHFKGFCKSFTFQKEQGNETDYVHWSIELSLIKKEYFHTFKNLLGFNDAHIEPTKNYFASKNYNSKNETRIEGPYTEKSVFITDIITGLRDWQMVLYMELKEKVDKDKWIWYYNKNGGAGKSEFCRYMLYNHKNVAVFTNGKTSDLAYAMTDNIEIVLYDVPRSSQERINYGALECLKNGLIFSGKYESKTKIFNRPHLVVFANVKPDMDYVSNYKIVLREL